MGTLTTTPLREAMRNAIRLRNLSPRTERTYLSLVARFALFYHRSPDRLDRPQIEQYLLHLRDTLCVSYCLFKQTVAALRFFYLHVMDRPDLIVRIPYGRAPKPLPVVLSSDELLTLLASIDSLRDRVLLTLLYSVAFVWVRSAAYAAPTSTLPAPCSTSATPRARRIATLLCLPSLSICFAPGGSRLGSDPTI